jgi:predicted lipoprotein
MAAKIDSALPLSYLIAAVRTDKDSAFKRFTHALDIGNYRYVFIKTPATVTAVKEDEVLVEISAADSLMHDILATEYIYGNAIRDASGLLDLRDYPHTTDLDRISEQINGIVRTTVLPPFKKTVKKGDKLNITAAVQLNMEHIKWDGLELIPVRLQIVD